MAGSHFVGIHHVGICVRDLEAALAAYGERLGLAAPPTRLETDEIRAALLAVGPELLEIFEPRDPAGPLGRFMERRGEGLHHVAYRVDDIEAALRDLSGRGVRLVDNAPRPGLHPGWRIAFIHPASATGVLTELVQVDPVEPIATPTVH
jgi:methylmalonyl-CoA/ethylmalonyl-CoA epimerase